MKNPDDLKIPDFPIGGDFNTYHKYSQEVLQIITKAYGEIPFYTQESVNDVGKSMSFYRARRTNEILNQFIFTEYSYPPTTFCKKALRANLPFHPVFYATNNALNSIYETIQNKQFKGEILAISNWTMRDTHPFYTAPFLFSNLSINHPWSKMVEKFKTDGLLYAGVPSSKVDEILMVLEKLTNLFYNDSDYRISASIAHNLLYSTRSDLKCDIFIYPSIQANGENVNFAVHPNFATNRLFLEKIYIVELGEYNTISKSLKLLLHSIGYILEDKFINWKNGNFDDDEYNIYKQSFGIK